MSEVIRNCSQVCQGL